MMKWRRGARFGGDASFAAPANRLLEEPAL
jgi:hypothetical protein